MNLLEHWRALLGALALMSRLPFVPRFQWSAAAQHLSPVYYPLVGALLGGVLWAVSWLMAAWPVGLTAFVIVVLWVALTGALHLDGLADSVDGYAAGHRCTDAAERSDRILRVMHDPASGPMAVVALVSVLLGKWLALEALLTRPLTAEVAFWCLLLALPRVMLLPVLMSSRYARPMGLASGLSGGRSSLAYWAALGVTLSAPLMVFPAVPAVGLLVMLGLVTWAWRAFWQRQIGGYTGDTLGALVECLEVLLLWYWLLVLMGWPS
ncbi:adenosylcobinamide-GDP ribazoletransferase [Marinimicrobium sp. ARAG 43.8]|uniref:adenosylcobinamide-GDP ribazoletransferase n=1 Tax=Marinimicrobium sp. ARAG 43.8 TaxID=3418719 RepID=UPI003CEF3CA2